MTEIRVKMQLTEEQEERLSYLKEVFKITNNAKLFKKLLELKI